MTCAHRFGSKGPGQGYDEKSAANVEAAGIQARNKAIERREGTVHERDFESSKREDGRLVTTNWNERYNSNVCRGNDGDIYTIRTQGREETHI